MKTEVGRNWYQSIHFDKLSVSKCTKDAENVYAPLVMVSIWGPEKDISRQVYQNGSIDPVSTQFYFH
jgi:hypothetical protein